MAAVLLVHAYYDGFSVMDYTLERKKYSVRASTAFAQKNKARLMGVGMGFVLMMAIPIIGWLAAPGYGTVAATLSALDIIESENKKTPGQEGRRPV